MYMSGIVRSVSVGCGRHPDQTSDALGAAAVQIGPNALGLAAEIKHGLGVSYGKVARLLETSWGLHLARSTVARADERLANRLAPTYQQLLLRLRASEVVHADETGWKVAGQTAWLSVFADDRVSVYTIDPTRARGGRTPPGRKLCRGAGLRLLFGVRCVENLHQSKCAGHLAAPLGGDHGKQEWARGVLQPASRPLLRAAVLLNNAAGIAKSVRRLRRDVWPVGSGAGSVARRTLHRPGECSLR